MNSCLLLLHVTCPAWGFQGFCSTPRQVERPPSGTLTVITVEGKRAWWGLTPAIRHLTQKWHMSLPLMSWWPEPFIWSYPTAERPGNAVPPGTQEEEPEIIDELHKRQHIHQDHTLLKTLPSSLSLPSSSMSPRAEDMRCSKCDPYLLDQPYLHCSPHASSLPRPRGLSKLVPWTHSLPIPWSVYELTYEDLGQIAPLWISPLREECPLLPSLMHCSLLSCPFCVFMCTCLPPLRPHGTVAMCYSFQNVHMC